MIYFLFAITILLLVLAEKQKVIPSRMTFQLCAVLILILFAFRGIDVGGDTKEYVAFFLGKGSSYGSLEDNTLEFGFNLYVKVMRLISDSAFGFIFSTAFISLFPFFLFVRKSKTTSSLPYLYILCFISFTVCIETNLRQNIAVSAFLLAIYIYMYTKRSKLLIVLCVILTAIALMGHNSNFIVIPVFLLLCSIKFPLKVSVILMVFSYVTSIISYEYLSDIFSILNIIFTDSTILDHYSTYGTNGFYEIEEPTSFNFFTLSLTLWPIINILACDPKERDNIFMKCMVVSCIIYNFFSPFPIAFRMIYLFQYLSLCYVPRKIWNNNIFFCLNLLLIMSWLRVLLITTLDVASQNPDAHMFPYNFIWE